MVLVESADHADVLRDSAARLGQVRVAAHARRGERLHGVGVHRRNVFQDRHHAAAGVVSDALAGAMGQVDQLAVVGGHELVENPRRDHRRRSAAAAKLENIVAVPANDSTNTFFRRNRMPSNSWTHAGSS